MYFWNILYTRYCHTTFEFQNVKNVQLILDERVENDILPKMIVFIVELVRACLFSFRIRFILFTPKLKGELRPEISLLHIKVLTLIKAKSNVSP